MHIHSPLYYSLVLDPSAWRLEVPNIGIIINKSVVKNINIDVFNIFLNKNPFMQRQCELQWSYRHCFIIVL